MVLWIGVYVILFVVIPVFIYVALGEFVNKKNQGSVTEEGCFGFLTRGIGKVLGVLLLLYIFFVPYAAANLFTSYKAGFSLEYLGLGVFDPRFAYWLALGRGGMYIGILGGGSLFVYLVFRVAKAIITD